MLVGVIHTTPPILQHDGGRQLGRERRRRGDEIAGGGEHPGAARDHAVEGERRVEFDARLRGGGDEVYVWPALRDGRPAQGDDLVFRKKP